MTAIIIVYLPNEACAAWTLTLPGRYYLRKNNYMGKASRFNHNEERIMKRNAVAYELMEDFINKIGLDNTDEEEDRKKGNR